MINKRGLRSRKGQVTIFVIIAVLIVAGVVLFFLIRPEGDFNRKKAIEKPQSYIHSCIEPELKEIVTKIALQGGSMEPSPFTIYKGEKIGYLCYINTPYYECVVQQPFLKTHIKNEIEKNIEDDIENCFNQLEQIYVEEGYEVNLKRGKKEIDLTPGGILIDLPEHSINIIKGKESEKHSNFKIRLDYNLYKMGGIAENIVEKEIIAGKAEPLLYMFLYHDLKIERDTKYDGTNIYTITERETGNKFRFASKSLFFP